MKNLLISLIKANIMSKVDRIWNNFFKSIMTSTFSEFLTQDQINERANWMITEYKKIKPHYLYKNIVYMLNNNAISEMAVGYKLHFLQDNYNLHFCCLLFFRGLQIHRGYNYAPVLL